MGVKRDMHTATAYHEAGHVVAAFYLRRPFRFVSIQHKDDILGHAVTRTSYYRYRVKIAHKGFIDVNAACISAAGPEAEKRYRGRYNHRGAQKDYKMILNIARGVDERGCGAPPDSPMAHAIFRASLLEAGHLLDIHWNKVVRVARELLCRETLTDKDVSKLMKKRSKTRRRKAKA